MSGPSADCPENSTSEDPFPVPPANAIASPATARPTSGVSSTIRRFDVRPHGPAASHADDRAEQRRRPGPMTSAQPNSSHVGLRR